jgi:hypothetical protein
MQGCMVFMQVPGRFASIGGRWFGDITNYQRRDSAVSGRDRAMRLLIEIAAAALLVICISASSAAAAAKPGRSADGLSCSFSVPANATPAARCAAIRRQCGGKFYANYCGDKLVSGM